MSQEACAICHSTDIELVPYNNHERKSSAVVLKHRLGMTLRQWGLRAPWLEHRLLFTPTLNIIRCRACGYGRYERPFAPGELEAYYGRRYFLAGGLPREEWDDDDFVDRHEKTRGQWAFVEPYLPAGGPVKMLDIGAAASRMSRLMMQKLGGRVECWVVEPGNGWEEYYQFHDIHVAGRFFPCEDPRRYDYIHTSHWLEHVAELEPVLAAMRQRVTEGGLTFIEVPNCDATYFERDFPDSPHIHFFTAASLTQAMRQHGFEPVMVRECAMPNPEYFRFRHRTASLTQGEKRIVERTESSILQVEGGSLLRGLFKAA